MRVLADAGHVSRAGVSVSFPAGPARYYSSTVDFPGYGDRCVFRAISRVSEKESNMSKNTTRLVTRAGDGTLRIKDYPSPEALLKFHTQIGIDDCSTDLGLRGMPVFRGLIGPIPEGKDVVRYESPDVFETLTKEWSIAKPKRRRRRSRAEVKSQSTPHAAHQ